MPREDESAQAPARPRRVAVALAVLLAVTAPGAAAGVIETGPRPLTAQGTSAGGFGEPVSPVGRRAGAWKRVLARSGTDTYQSPRFKVGRRWRIVYRCGAMSSSPYGSVLTQFSWTSTEPLGPEGSFAANRAGPRLRIYYPASGAGTFQLQVKPFEPGTTWYVEVDSLVAGKPTTAGSRQ